MDHDDGEGRVAALLDELRGMENVTLRRNTMATGLYDHGYLLAREAIAHGGLAGAVLNGAKEAALEAFIAGRIGFLEIAAAVEAAMENLLPGLPRAFGLDDVFEADQQAHDAVAARLASRP